MTIEEAIGANVRRRREWIGITQEQLGQLLGEHLGQTWTRQAVSSAERGGRDFRAVELVALARALVTTVGYLTQPEEPVTLPSGHLVDPAEAWNQLVGDAAAADLTEALQSIETLKEAISLSTEQLESVQRSLALADRAVVTVEAFARIAADRLGDDR